MAKNLKVDGFVPRRSPRTVGAARVDRRLPQANVTNLQRHGAPVSESTKNPQPTTNALVPVQQHGLTRSDIDESLNQIDEQSKQDTQKHKRGGLKSRRRKIIKWAIIAVLLIFLAGGLWVGVRALIASKSVFKGDIFGLIQQKKLQQDANGRTNILILGTSEDDPGHEGATLTDSIMVLSVDQTNNNAYMISIPRDMPVRYGMVCNSGYSGKINEYFNCVNQDYKSDAAETERQTKSREFFGEILGISIQYSAHVNYSVMRDVVSALGGITVTIQGSNGDPGVMDSNFDWKCKGGNEWASLATMKKNCPPNGHYIDYPNGPVKLDAEHALYLAQARGDSAPTYGLSRSNFDREQNQQKIVKAMKDKAMSTGTLTNPIKVSNLIDAIGSNLRTNFETSEIATLVSLAQKIPNNAIVSLDLQKDGIMLDTGSPAAGDFNFTKLQAYVKKKLYATGISKEDAHVIVLNGSGVTGVAQVEADKLTALGMTIDAVANAPQGQYTTNTVIQIAKDAKPETAKKLASLYGATPTVATTVPGVTVGDSTDYIIILMTANTSATGNTSEQ